MCKVTSNNNTLNNCTLYTTTPAIALIGGAFYFYSDFKKMESNKKKMKQKYESNQLFPTQQTAEYPKGPIHSPPVKFVLNEKENKSTMSKLSLKSAMSLKSYPEKSLKSLRENQNVPNQKSNVEDSAKQSFVSPKCELIQTSLYNGNTMK
ncbi:hypothetical protein BLOT_014310 [Blomia tropicalis]|nr:hypothetical protein BLOT_014310 [Blomia tropicalis]